jgi:predicted oxidoreductase
MRIDLEGRVLNAEGEPIPGLFAAGMCAAGAYGRLNPGSGLNMAWNFYTGRLVGRTVAQ